MTLPSLDHYLKRGQQYAATRDNVEPAALAEFLDQVEGLTRQAAVNLSKSNKKDRRHHRRDEACQWVRDAGEDGISVAEVRDRLTQLYPGETPPSDTAIQNWYASHPNITKPGRAVYFWTNTPDTTSE